MPPSATQRREELLDQLVTLFLAEGFRQFTLADLCARLHCSKSTLYALGQTKDEVTVNAVRRFFRTATGQVEAAVAAAGAAGLARGAADLARGAADLARGDADPGQGDADLVRGAAAGRRIAYYLHAIGDALRPASAAFMTDLAGHAFAREIYQQNTAIAARRVSELIAEGVSSGEFRPVHASFVADTAAAAMERIQGGAVLAATGLGDADAYDELAALLLDGIRERVSS